MVTARKRRDRRKGSADRWERHGASNEDAQASSTSEAGGPTSGARWRLYRWIHPLPPYILEHSTGLLTGEHPDVPLTEEHRNVLYENSTLGASREEHPTVLHTRSTLPCFA